MQLDISRRSLTETRKQQHEIIEGEVSASVRGEYLADPLSERILLELGALGNLAVRKLDRHQLLMKLRILSQTRLKLEKYLNHLQDLFPVQERCILEYYL